MHDRKRIGQLRPPSGFGHFAWLLVLTLTPLAARAQNLGQNPGFETGNTSGWFGFGSATLSAQTSVVHSGSYAARVQDRVDPWNGIAQSLKGVLQPGQTYTLAVWARMETGSETLQMTVKKVDGAGSAYAPVAIGGASSTGWTQLIGQYPFSVSGALQELTLYMEVPSSGTAVYYADDLLVQPVSSDDTGTNGVTTVHWDEVGQRIDGFGASSAWRSSWTTALADMFFSTNSGQGTAADRSRYDYTGIGLSLLRTRIAPGGTTWEHSLMQMAQARGARVWSAPWSPEVQFKSNGNVNGGSFVGTPANYQAYANQLAGYVVSMKNQYGVNLYALSVQNEPDADVTTYESCNWTAQQIHDFIPYLSSALIASNVGATKIMLPESQNWTDPQGLHVATMNDPATAALVGIIANHNYVADNVTGDQTTPAAIDRYGKALWETEVYAGSDNSMDDALYHAGRVHLFLTAAQVNAWHYWWLTSGGNGGLCDDNDVPTKRMYTVGNFSRFVRPGYHRIGATGTGTLWVSAYKDLTNGHFAVVALNKATNAVTQSVQLNGFNAGSVTPWVTSDTLSLVAQPAVTVSNSSFVFTLPARSVVTFTGQGSVNTPPVLQPVGDQVIGAGIVLSLTNSATDVEAPPQTLTFTALEIPTNASLDNVSGVFTWRPLVSQANTTNLVTIKVEDDGVPALSDTNRCQIIVNPIEKPVLGLTAATGSAVTIEADGPVGPDYTLLTSTNLEDWQLLFSTNPPVTPFTLTVTNTGEGLRLYRIEVGP